MMYLVDTLRALYEADGGRCRGRDPVRAFLGWLIKTAFIILFGLVIGGLTLVGSIGAWAGIPELTSVMGIVFLALFVTSHFMWMGRPRR